MSVGEKTKGKSNSTQHRGTGKYLLKMAEWIAWTSGTRGTAVITGEGVRAYYHKRGYKDDDTFVIKNWLIKWDEFLKGIIFCCSVIISYFLYNPLY